MFVIPFTMNDKICQVFLIILEINYIDYDLKPRFPIREALDHGCVVYLLNMIDI